MEQKRKIFLVIFNLFVVAFPSNEKHQNVFKVLMRKKFKGVLG
jgi:hypothetical protein